MPVAASAQVLDQYFPPLGASVGGASADTSQARAATEYDPYGLHIGEFLIQPDLTAQLGNDTDADDIRGGKSAAVVQVAGTLEAKSQWAVNALDATAGFENLTYPALGRRNRTTWTVGADGTHEFGSDQAGFSYSHLDLVETSADIGALTITDQLNPFHVDTVAASYTSPDHGPFTLVPGFDVTETTFDNVVTPATPQGESFRDRVTVDEDLTTKYALAPRENALFVIRGTEIRYTDLAPAELTRDSNGISILTGLDFDTLGPFRYRVLVGYQHRAYQAGLFHALSSPVVEASVEWTPTRLLTVTALIRRDIQDAAAENIGGFTYTAGQLDALYEFRRNVQLSLHAQIEHADFQPTVFSILNVLQPQPSQLIYGAGLSAIWKLDRRLRLTASSNLSLHRSEGLGTYNENITSFGIGVAF